MRWLLISHPNKIKRWKRSNLVAVSGRSARRPTARRAAFFIAKVSDCSAARRRKKVRAKKKKVNKSRTLMRTLFALSLPPSEGFAQLFSAPHARPSLSGGYHFICSVPFRMRRRMIADLHNPNHSSAPRDIKRYTCLRPPLLPRSVLASIGQRLSSPRATFLYGITVFVPLSVPSLLQFEFIL